MRAGNSTGRMEQAELAQSWSDLSCWTQRGHHAGMRQARHKTARKEADTRT